MSKEEAASQYLKQYVKVNLLFVKQGRAEHLFEQSLSWAYAAFGRTGLRTWWKFRSQKCDWVLHLEMWFLEWDLLTDWHLEVKRLLRRKVERKREKSVSAVKRVGRGVRASAPRFPWMVWRPQPQFAADPAHQVPLSVPAISSWNQQTQACAL